MRYVGRVGMREKLHNMQMWSCNCRFGQSVMQIYSWTGFRDIDSAWETCRE